MHFVSSHSPHFLIALTALIFLSASLDVSPSYGADTRRTGEEKAQWQKKQTKKRARKTLQRRKSAYVSYIRDLDLEGANSEKADGLLSLADASRERLLGHYTEIPPIPELWLHALKRGDYAGQPTPADEEILLRSYGTLYPLDRHPEWRERIRLCKLIDIARGGDIERICDIVERLGCDDQNMSYFRKWRQVIGNQSQEVTKILFSRLAGQSDPNITNPLVHSILSLRRPGGEEFLSSFKEHQDALYRYLLGNIPGCRTLTRSVTVDELFEYLKETRSLPLFSVCSEQVSPEDLPKIPDSFVKDEVHRHKGPPPYLMGYQAASDFFIDRMQSQALHRMEMMPTLDYDFFFTFLYPLFNKQIEFLGGLKGAPRGWLFLAKFDEHLTGTAAKYQSLLSASDIPQEFRMVATLRYAENKLGISGRFSRLYIVQIGNSDIEEAYEMLGRVYVQASKKKLFANAVLFRMAQIELGIFGTSKYKKLKKGVVRLKKLVSPQGTAVRFAHCLLSYYLGQISEEFIDIPQAIELLKTVKLEEPEPKRMFERQLCEIQMGLFGEEHKDYETAISGREEDEDHEYLYLIYSGFFGAEHQDEEKAALHVNIDEELAAERFPYLAFLKAREHYYAGNLERSVELLKRAVDKGFYFACIPLIKYHLHQNAPIEEVLRLILEVQQAGLMDQLSGRFLAQVQARGDEVVDMLKENDAFMPLKPYFLPGLTDGGERGAGKEEEEGGLEPEACAGMTLEPTSSDDDDVVWKESKDFQDCLQQEQKKRDALSPPDEAAPGIALPGLFSRDRELEAEMDRLLLGQVTQNFLLKLLVKLGAFVMVSEGSTLKFRITFPGNERTFGFHNVHYGNRQFKMTSYWAKLKKAILQRYEDILDSEGGD